MYLALTFRAGSLGGDQSCTNVAVTPMVEEKWSLSVSLADDSGALAKHQYLFQENDRVICTGDQ